MMYVMKTNSLDPLLSDAVSPTFASCLSLLPPCLSSGNDVLDGQEVLLGYRVPSSNTFTNKRSWMATPSIRWLTYIL